jgi:hypothetical protein
MSVNINLSGVFEDDPESQVERAEFTPQSVTLL